MKCFLLFLLTVISTCSVHSAEVGVRIRFGLTDRKPTEWDGSLSVSPGKIESLEGWRFEATDRVVGNNSWKASSRSLTTRRSNNANKRAGGRSTRGNMADNGLILLLTGVNENSVVKVKTDQGNFDFKLTDVGYGNYIEKLNGAVDVERVAASRPLSGGSSDDDYPSLAVAPDGTAYAVWISYTPGLDREERAKGLKEAPDDFAYLAKKPGGDQLWLRVQQDGSWSKPIAVTAGHGDLYKCCVSVDGKGRAWITWSENRNWTSQDVANFEIWTRSYDRGRLSDP
ncbi:MAG: hypothetical protein KJT03_17035, partial [Verrucomicrobiae bacterium]|nr:hypothetical protein [Verrucomicrobiae bacterium]